MIFTPPAAPTAAPLSEVVNSVSTLSGRARVNSLLGVTHNGNRDMFEVFGYPDNLAWSDYFAMFKRNGMANRITRGVARSCWRDMPTIEVDDSPIIEEEFKALLQRKLFRKLENADTLNRIGRFSVLFVGIPDGNDADQPLGKAKGNEAINSVFFQAYSEEGIEVSQWESEPSNPRFGLPVLYALRVVGTADDKLNKDQQTRTVHHSRVVHIAEDALDNDLEGMSSLEPIYNYLLDLIKVQGGASEAYWRNARRVMAFNAKEGFGNAKPEQLDQLRDDIEAFTNGWKDGLRLGGVEVQQLNATHADPKETFMTCLKMISAATGIPLRILTGEGGGQTTGNEDKAAYNQIIKDRQEMMCSDWLLQVLGITGRAGLHDEIPLNAVVVWPVNESLNEVDKSIAAKNRGDALKATAEAIGPMGGLAGEVSPEQAVMEVLGFEPDAVTSDGLTDEDILEASQDGVVET